MITGTPNGTQLMASAIRWTGYLLSFGMGLLLWPRLMEMGVRFENTHFGLALLFNWFCLPVSMTITSIISYVAMRIAALWEPSITAMTLSKQIQTASMLGVLSALGSCGMMVSGFEPPPPFDDVYQLDFNEKYR